MALVEVFFISVFLSLLLYKWLAARHGVLQQRGIPHDKPLPLLGNLDWGALTGRTSFILSMTNTYKKYKNNKIYGSYRMQDPMIFLTDTNHIKKVMIKDFDHFPNHKSAVNGQPDSIFTKSLISLEDRKWKEMRNTLTPSFTGNKMRLMFELINECSIEGVRYIELELQASGEPEIDLEMKEYFSKFANDVIASAAFGLKVNSFKDKTNEFYTIGQTIFQLKKLAIIKILMYQVIPKLMKALRVKLVDEKMIKYFKRLVTDAMNFRKKNKIIRPDMIHLLMEAKRNFDETKSERSGEHAEFNEDDVLAQCLLFFLAGFETVSTCLSFTIYELLMNPDVQERLYNEVLEMEKKLDGKPLDYDSIMNMKYMGMVISESLRKWPPAIATDRVCAADYKLCDEDGNLFFEFLKNDHITIPIIAMHHDPDYFPDPEVFDPERFSDERKHEFNSSAYMPFGAGPRNCIGNRLALMEIKSMIYHILLKFKMAPAEKTAKDIMNSLQSFRMQPKELFWTKCIPRKH